MNRFNWVSLFLTMGVALSCSTEIADRPDPTIHPDMTSVVTSFSEVDTTSGMATSAPNLPLGCNQSHLGKVSGCGGFETPAEKADVPESSTVESLAWDYDSEGQALRIVHVNSPMNCCGERSVRLDEFVDRFEMVETDLVGPGRCRCICQFDFTVKATGVAGSEVELVVRREGEGLEPAEIYRGLIDLTQKSGVIYPKYPKG